jgi:hypothetical protein
MIRLDSGQRIVAAITHPSRCRTLLINSLANNTTVILLRENRRTVLLELFFLMDTKKMVSSFPGYL